jgi:hypothetical protein
MAIYASTSTITTQTVPLIIVDPATVQDKYWLRWDASIGAFIPEIMRLTDIEVVDLESSNIEGILPVDKGGTGLDSYNSGDILYANSEGLLETLQIGTGDNSQVLTISNGFPIWEDTTNLKNIVISQLNSFTVSSDDITTLPENSQLKSIIIHIDQAYDTDDIIVSDESETLISSNEILTSQVGTYIYSLDKFYTLSETLSVVITDATTGSMRIFVEYTRL